MNPYRLGAGEGRPAGVPDGDGNVARRDAAANPNGLRGRRQRRLESNQPHGRYARHLGHIALPPFLLILRQGKGRPRAGLDRQSRIVAMSFCEPRSWTRVLSS